MGVYSKGNAISGILEKGQPEIGIYLDKFGGPVVAGVLHTLEPDPEKRGVFVRDGIIELRGVDVFDERS